LRNHVRLWLAAMSISISVFFFQAEDGIRDRTVTGVQTLLFRSPNSSRRTEYRGGSGVASPPESAEHRGGPEGQLPAVPAAHPREIGRASCRERVSIEVGREA